MNVVAPRQARLIVEVIFDFVCPWSYLGVHRLSLLQMRRPDLAIQLVWWPFLLNPDMPRGGMSRMDYALRKFGGEDRARRLFKAIRDVGAADGLQFEFDRIRRTPSSIDAHRLIRFAESSAVAEALVLSIFRAYFHDGADIGKHEVLVSLAAQTGLDRRTVSEFLASDEAIECVHSDNLQAHRLGINGVPCFVIDQSRAIAGAQEPEVLEKLCDLVKAESPADVWST